MMTENGRWSRCVRDFEGRLEKKKGNEGSRMERKSLSQKKNKCEEQNKEKKMKKRREKVTERERAGESEMQQV